MGENSYKAVYQGGSGEIEEKKSRFIATIRPVESEEEAVSFIAEMKKQYWDARHNCSAFIIGRNQELTRCSDDGEPSGTAGRPMLDVLLKEGIHNAAVVVTRYFGGTLLGTGGLVRAYSGAAQEGLRNSTVLEKRPGKQIRITTDYSGIGKIQYILGQNQIPVMDSQYTEEVEVRVMAPLEQAQQLKAEITEATSGRAKIDESDPVYYGILEGEVLVF